ncbi:MAG: hypothetical protein SynsKO_27560 [Synoicihabitans sp.]
MTAPSSDHPNTVSKNHRVLYHNDQGRRVRNACRANVLLGLVAAGVGAVLFTQVEHAQITTIPPAVVSGFGLLLMALAMGFAIVSWQTSQRYVIHLEVWPQSHLAVTRKAGFGGEQVNLLAWRDFRTAVMSEMTETPPVESSLKIRLGTGKRVNFDHVQGAAPHGWAALGRFLTKCSLPEALALAEGDAPLTLTGWATEVS